MPQNPQQQMLRRNGIAAGAHGLVARVNEDGAYFFRELHFRLQK
jgi:hypothetical protein